MTAYLNFAWRFVLLLLAQQFIFNQLPLGNGLCFVFILPLAFYTLPFDTPRVPLVVLGFLAGLLTDAFESSYGLYTLCFSALCYAIGLVRYRFYTREDLDNKHHGILDHNVLKNAPFVVLCNLFVLLVFYLVENFQWAGTDYAILRAFLGAILSSILMFSVQWLFGSARSRSR